MKIFRISFPDDDEKVMIITMDNEDEANLFLKLADKDWIVEELKDVPKEILQS